MPNISETLASAFQHHQAGRLPQASQLYQEILRRNPNHFDALQLLGIIAAQCHDYQLATEYFSKAVKQNPSVPGLHYNLGNVLQEQGQLAAATASYQQALALDPNSAEAHNNLGLVLEKQGELAAAITHYKLAIALQPNQAQAYQNLGLALQKQGNLAAAISYFQQAVTLQPDCAGFQINLANVLQEQQRWHEAIAHYQQALFLQPDLAEIYHNLGIALHSLQRWDEAIAHYQQALVIQPDVAEIYSNLAATKRKQWRFDEAIAYYRRALHLQPHAEIHDNLGMVLHEQLRLEEAIAHYQQALTLKPNFPNAHFNLSMALLLGGNLPQGFSEYEWRWQKVDSPPRPFFEPVWDGSSLEGQTILLHGEQGFGDQIQFIRYVLLVAQFQGRIVVECSRELVRLFATMPGINQVLARGEFLPTFDVHAPLMSLPLILGTTLETIPVQIPYLYSTVKLSLLGETAANNNLKVGITWAGSPLLTGNQNRFCSLEDFLPLLDIPNIAFYSLQTGLQAQKLMLSVPIQDLSPQLNDFADTGSILTQLDLVISIDTAVAHLAGALGKPAWVLLPFAPDWRWLLHREDSPWYPTLRLFRQPQPGDWAGVMQQVKQALLRMGMGKANG